MTLRSCVETPIRFTANDGDGKYVYIGTLYFRGEDDFVAEMGTDKILDVSVFVDVIPAKGGSVNSAVIYYTFDTTRKQYVFTDFLVEAESLGTTYSPTKKRLQLVPFTIRESGQIYEGSFLVEQQANEFEEEFIIDEYSIQPHYGEQIINDVAVAEPYLSEFDSKSHQKAFYITVLANAYYRKTYTSGSVQNMGMQYNVAMTNKAVFKFYEEGSA